MLAHTHVLIMYTDREEMKLFVCPLDFLSVFTIIDEQVLRQTEVSFSLVICLLWPSFSIFFNFIVFP
jgi:hypothetical protein